MLPILGLALLSQGGGTQFRAQFYDGLLGPQTIKVQTPIERAPRAKISPRFSWEFDWSSAGYVNYPEAASLCFELYSQESTQGSARPENVVRTLMRLYSYNVAKLKLEHSPEFGGGLVSVYLCYGGEPGGEQLYDVDRQDGRETKVNSIYFYDLKSLTNPVETVREVAHEYGHATLPPVGGFTAPENWANGYLGEKLYLGYLRDAMAVGKLAPEDAMGATKAGLDEWLKANVDPLIADAATNGPRPALLAGTGKASMDAFLGLALWTARLYDEKAMVKALFINGTQAKGFVDAITEATELRDVTSLKIPAALRSKPVWVPVGTYGRVSGVKVLERKPGWVRIQAGTAPAVVINNHK